MSMAKVLVSGLKILAVCVVFSLSLVIGGALSGLSNIGQQAPQSPTVQQVPAQQTILSLPKASPKPQPAETPENFLRPFLIFSVCVGFVLSYLVLRSTWYGWPLVAAISVGIYGVSTVAPQIESVFFLSNKLPRGMIRALFLQGAIATALFAPLAVLLLGKWRAVSQAPAPPAPTYMRASFWAWRLALIVVAFVFLYMFFGYYVAWQNPAARQYYGGPEYASFYAALKANWMYRRSIYALQVFRAMLYAGCLYPLVRMLRAARWEAALAMALFLSVWTTVLLLPNPIMPSSVARTHFWETLGFGLVFGALAGWLLSTPPERIAKLR
jgi:hypothetical protein